MAVGGATVAIYKVLEGHGGMRLVFSYFGCCHMVSRFVFVYPSCKPGVTVASKYF